MSDTRESKGYSVQENRWSQNTSGRMTDEVGEVSVGGMFIIKNTVTTLMTMDFLIIRAVESH